jgi:hypothetical protein
MKVYYLRVSTLEQKQIDKKLIFLQMLKSTRISVAVQFHLLKEKKVVK